MNLREADHLVESWWREFGEDWWRDHGQAMEGAHRGMGLARSRPKTGVRIEDCRKIVGQRYGVDKDEMLSKSRPRNVARPRQMAMKLARELAGRSSPDIALHFRRDHTTVLHAIRAVRAREANSDVIRGEMDNFRLTLLTYKFQREVATV